VNRHFDLRRNLIVLFCSPTSVRFLVPRNDASGGIQLSKRSNNHVLIAKKDVLITNKNVFITNKKVFSSNKKVFITKKKVLITNKNVFITNKKVFITKRDVLITRKNILIRYQILSFQTLNRLLVLPSKHGYKGKIMKGLFQQVAIRKFGNPKHTLLVAFINRQNHHAAWL